MLPSRPPRCTLPPAAGHPSRSSLIAWMRATNIVCAHCAHVEPALALPALQLHFTRCVPVSITYAAAEQRGRRRDAAHDAPGPGPERQPQAGRRPEGQLPSETLQMPIIQHSRDAAPAWRSTIGQGFHTHTAWQHQLAAPCCKAGIVFESAAHALQDAPTGFAAVFKGERDEGTPGQTGASARGGANTPKGGHKVFLRCDACLSSVRQPPCYCAGCNWAPLHAALGFGVNFHVAVSSCIICMCSRSAIATYRSLQRTEQHTATRRCAGMNELQNPQTPTLPNALGGAAPPLLLPALTSITVAQITGL